MATPPAAVTKFWPDFGDSSKFIEVKCSGPSGSLAEDVLTKFNISKSASANAGGNLTNLDIKHMDALSVIRLSLLEELGESNGKLYELSIDEYGDVDFVDIGAATATMPDIYYQVQSSSYKETCVGVMVTGGKPFAERKVMDWKLIWEDENGVSSKKVYDTSLMTMNCTFPDYSTHAIITFTDPNLQSTYKDGIENLYDNVGAFETIIGYARCIDAPGSTENTQIIYKDSDTVIPIQLGTGDNNPDLGTLLPREVAVNTPGFDSCWRFATSGGSGSSSTAIKVPIPSEMRYVDLRGRSVDKFIEVEQVLIVGVELDWVHPGGRSASEMANGFAAGKSLVYVASNNIAPNVYRLEAGKHYVVVYEDGSTPPFKDVYIQFAKEVREQDLTRYGNNTEFKVRPGCAWYNSGKTGSTGTILPCGENRGFFVMQVWAMVRLDTPSIQVSDPESTPGSASSVSSKAIDIAKDLKYWVAPMILVDTQPSVAFKGQILDPSQGVIDSDPTTAQVLEDTELEKAYDIMAGGSGLTLSFPFITDDDVLKNLSQELEDAINSNNGIETTYICGPGTEVSIGDTAPDGGIINSISYSYSDSSSYMISVTSGAKFLGLSGGMSGGPSYKATEAVSCRGTVIQDLGNHIHYKVRLDGFGDRTAINTASDILRVGDIVSCSVHNNPVEV